MPSETSRIASTPLLGLVPLGGAGDRAYGRLIDALSTRFRSDPRYSAILAEPEPFEDGSAVNWHVPGHVRAIPLSQIRDEQTARTVQNTLLEVSRGIRAYADELDEAKRSATDRSLADALRNAMCVPGPEFIYAVGDQPVLVAWAYHRDTERPMEVGIVRQVHDEGAAPSPAVSVPAAAAPVVPPAPVVAVGSTPVISAAPLLPIIARPFPWGWILWLLFAAIVATILWLLLRACALNVANTWFPGLAWCGASSSIVHDDTIRIAELQALIDNLEGQAASRHACAIPPHPAGGAPTENITAIDVQKRLIDAHATSGELDISLAWNGPADLDLYVMCSTGETVYYGHKSGCGGGEHQVDLNAGNNRSNEPVEHITFPSIAAIPHGALKIGVSWYADHDETRTTIPVIIVVKRAGQSQEIHVDIPKPTPLPGAPVIYQQISIP